MSSINEKIIINKMNKPELIGNIIDIFEDFLDDKGIIIPNPEKDEDPELDMESPANIYEKITILYQLHWRTCFEAGASLNLLNLSVS